MSKKAILSETLPEPKYNIVKLNLETNLEHGIDLSSRVIRLYGEVNDSWFDILDAGLTYMERKSPRKTVTIRINSEGGYCYSAQACIGRITSSSCHIITEGYGCVMSAATLVLGAGDRRKLSRYCTFMWHQSSYSLQTDKHSEQLAYVQQAEKERLQWCKYMTEFSKAPMSFWDEGTLGKDKYYDLETLKDKGYIEEIF